jgi:dTDP-4-amino-4,6-dideoxygalactose transaminase
VVAFLDVGFTYRALRPEIDAAIAGVLESGWFVRGAALEAFEAKFARFCGVAHAVGVANGFDALVLILRALKIGPGDEVIVSGHTFIATWLAVLQCGATIVPADADPATMNVDLDAVEALVTPRTRAVIVVHLYGTPVDVAKLRPLAERGIAIVEDAAQAHGAEVGGARVGSLGSAAAFSFYPGKNLGAFGDAGAVTTDDPELARRVRMLGNYGSEAKYRHDEVGVNSRLDELQAAILSVKLDALAEWNERRRAIARAYVDGLAGLDDLVLPQIEQGATQVWHLFVVRTGRRDALQQELARRGIATQIHYPIANHKSEALAPLFPGLRLPETERICATCLSLPIGPHMSSGDVDRVVSAMRAALAAAPATV